jgi:hypothetical protein
MAFQLPHNVTAKRTRISPTSFVYAFRHSELGELGRVLFCAGHTGDCHVTHQLCGAATDDLSAMRRNIFEPLAMAVATHLREVARPQEIRQTANGK